MHEKNFTIPVGFGLVALAYWASTHAEFENHEVYFAPQGSTLPNGNKIKEGEIIKLETIWFKPEEGERIKNFFKDKNNTRGWVKAWDAHD